MLSAAKYRLAFTGLLRSPAIGGLLHRGAWGLLDQALLSLATFVTLALIARSVSVHDFGLYSLAFAFINLEMTLASALLSDPFVVISASQQRERFAVYLSSTYLAHVAMALLVSAVLGVLALTALLLEWGNAAFILMVVPAMLAWQLQDFTRQPFYVQGKVAVAFWIDLLAFGGQMAAIAVAAYLDVLTITMALGLVAVSLGSALLVGLFLLRDAIAGSLHFSDFRSLMVETWRFGRWTLGGNLLVTASSYLQPFVLALFWGAAAAGELRAMVTLIGPSRIIIRGGLTAFTPLAASVVERDGKEGLRPLLKRMLLLTAPVMGAYVLLVSVRPNALVSALFGADYAGSADWLLPMVALGAFVMVIVLPVDVGLRALRVTNPLFRAGVLNFIAFWAFGVPVTYFFGLLGAALTLLVTPTILGAVLYHSYRRVMAGRPAETR